MKHKIQHYSLNQAFRFVFITLITGTGIGLSVSLVASFFVAGLHFFDNQRHLLSGHFSFLKISDGSLAPLIWLVVAALLLSVVRRIFGVVRWHGPADSIFGAHRLDNEIDVRAGIGSTAAAFV